MTTILSEVVMTRMQQGQAQRIHIPWPIDLVTDTKGSELDAHLDEWVAANIQLPERMMIVGTLAGTASISRGPLERVVIVTVMDKKDAALPGPGAFQIRNTWADGRGGVR